VLGRSSAVAVWVLLACGACLPLGNTLPEAKPLAGPEDTRWPTLAVEIQRVDPNAPWTYDATSADTDRILRVLRASDLFRSVALDPAPADWRARIEVRVGDEQWQARLVLEDAVVGTLYEGAREGEWNGVPTVPDFVRELLKEARGRGVFAPERP